MKDESKMKRNDKCYCGSDKKYKKCCKDFYDKNTTYLKDYYNECVEVNNEIVKCKDKKVEIDNYLYSCDLDNYCEDEWLNEMFNKKTQIRYLTKFKNLGEDLQHCIKLVLRNKPITIGNCHNNSTYISTLIDGVEKVDGFFSSSDTHPHLYKKYVDLGNGVFIIGFDKDKWDDMVKVYNTENSPINFDETKWIYDEKNDMEYVYHSWNKCGDIHFDLTLKVEWKYKKLEWLEYFECETKKQPNDELIKNLLTICDLHTLFSGKQSWVRNVGVLEKSIFDMIGYSDCDGKPIPKDDSDNWKNYVNPYDLQHQQNYLNLGGRIK